MPQLVFPFGVDASRRREDFVVAPCNENAFRFVERWPDWPARAVALHGPSGCGKSHLVALWQGISNAAVVSASMLPARDLEFAAGAAIAVEDVDAEGVPRNARDRALMSLFERPSGTLLLTGRTPPGAWAVSIADLRSRFDSLLAFPMWAPDDALLSSLVRKHFADRQLTVPESVVARIVTLVERTPDAIAAFVARADGKALAEKRAVTERLVTELVDAEERSAP